MGVMQIMTVYLVQQAVVSELHISSAPNLPNVFLVDITSDEIAGVRSLLKSQSSVTAEPELLPVVSSRILEIDGVEANKAKLKNFPKQDAAVDLAYMGFYSVAGTTCRAGRMVDACTRGGFSATSFGRNQPNSGRSAGCESRVNDYVRRAGQLVSPLRWLLLRSPTVSMRFHAQNSFFTPPSLAGLPVVWYGGVHADPQRVSELQRALYNRYPTVTVINVAQALETVRAVVIQITYVIQFLAAFSIFAGIVILASSIAGTRYRRIREVVVLKTLGATRARIATVFSIEFAVLGLVAGVVGDLLCQYNCPRTCFSRLTVVYHFQWIFTLAALFGHRCFDSWHRMAGESPHTWTEASRGASRGVSCSARFLNVLSQRTNEVVR